MATTENFESATNAIQFAAGQVAKIYGGPFGQAYAVFLTGQGGVVTSLADLFEKIDNGTATSLDVADALYDVASITVGFLVLTGLAASWTLPALGW